MSEAAQLRAIRHRLERIAPGAWSLVADGETSFLEAKDDMDVPCRLADFRPGASADEMAFIAAAPRDMRFLVGLVDRAIAQKKGQGGSSRPVSPAPQDEGPDAVKDFAAEAAMKCGTPSFKAFLAECHGLERPLTDDRCAQKLRSLLGVTSRRELNEGGAAAARWKRLRGEFEAWRRTDAQ